MTTTPHLTASAAIRRWMYADNFAEFRQKPDTEILGEIARSTEFSVETTQRDAWLGQIELLQRLQLPDQIQDQAKIYFEYTIPRLGRRADVVLIASHVLLVIEFKVGDDIYDAAALDQVWDYALDLKNFHQASHALHIAPVLVATRAETREIEVIGTIHDDGLLRPIRCNAENLQQGVDLILASTRGSPIDICEWEESGYLPTPTIIEAARALYADHSVEAISRSGAGATNLEITAKSVDQIITSARTERKKSICFVTGVPGAGKTLVGLDVANRHISIEEASYSVFLSGNAPLVAVLIEALARDKVARSKHSDDRIRIGKARKEVESFIQIVHRFRDEYLKDSNPPPEHVVLFDEAQRAWNLRKTSDFMARKKNRPNFSRSEPEFLISCMDRHPDWAVVVCLVGGGQEINDGEAGISEWLDAIFEHYPDWEIHVSPELMSSEYRCHDALQRILSLPGARPDPNLHLSVSMRSFRAGALSQFVRQVLDLDSAAAKETLHALASRYPLRITRSLDGAKHWLREQARGSERYGIVVSSKASRLKPLAIDVRVESEPVKWFLNGKDDTRSSYYLEDVATEFQVQGLELDWACVVWDGDFRYTDDSWSHHEFKGNKWKRVNADWRKRYLENAYRVLLTRARQGMVLVVPDGDPEDPTRSSDFYDPTYHYLKSLGIAELH